jgi:hypothetical protein
MPSTSLDTADFVELAELLQFPGDWLTVDHAQFVAVAPVQRGLAPGKQVLRSAHEQHVEWASVPSGMSLSASWGPVTAAAR